MFGYGGLELVLVPLALVGIVMLGIVALAGARGDPDPAGGRARTLYLCVVSFVALFTLVLAIPSAVSSLASLVLVEVEDEDELSDVCRIDPLHPECGTPGVTQYVNVFEGSSGEAQEAAWGRSALTAVTMIVAAAGVLRWHRTRWRELLDDASFASSPGARTYSAYLHAVAFTAMVVLLFAGATALFGLGRVVVPDAVSTGPSGAERDAGLVQLLAALAPGGAAVFVYVTHWRRTAPAERGA